MWRGSPAALAIVICPGACAAQAADRQVFDVPAGSLSTVVTRLAVQARATITIPDPAVARRSSQGVRGRFALRAAVSRVLRGTGATAIFYDGRTVRIVGRPRPVEPAPALPAPPPQIEPDIVVTASKQPSTRDRYPGSLTIIPIDQAWASRHAADGTAALVELLPSTGATNLGPARNKLFIRGIADSSFNGPTQATVGQYLGDIRLNYNSPDPNLNLYDMERIEVLVGPQGTLYGAGSLGGVIRLVPHMPDATAVAASVSSGLSATRDGRIGGDLAAMINVPIVADRWAVRLVGFAAYQPGYIDAPAERRRGINATGSIGQRLDVRLTPGSGWAFDAGVVIQNSVNRDGQYTLRGAPPLTRDAPIPQPFRNDYYLGYVRAAGPVGDAELVTATSLVSHQLRSIFDATGHDGTPTAARFVEDNRIVLLNHETRVSGGGARTSWVAGVVTAFNSSALLRTIGPPEGRAPVTGVVNDQFEAAAFGQLSRPLSPRLTVTVGGRFTLAVGTGRLITAAGLSAERATRQVHRFSGTLALDWRIDDRLSGFFHYQQGNRAGGLAVAPAGSSLSAQRFSGDDLNMNELGLRLGRDGDAVVVRTAVFAADWNFIQADLIDTTGIPYTANIGRGRIVGLDGTVTWRLSRALTASATAFVNYSDLYAPAPGFGGPGRNPLPNVAANGQRFALDWRRTIGLDTVLSANASIRYVGPSRLGIGPALDIPQGGYAVATLGARLDRGRFGIGLDIQNVANARGNTFAFGNPFGVAARDQITPLRPRTVRLSFDAEL